MRLDYNILCIDDEIDTLAETKRVLAAHNEEVGILTNFKDVSVKPAARETEPGPYKERIFAEIKAAFDATKFELIMVDLHLGPTDSPMGFKGHEIIQYIRETQTMYRPIVFYSSGDPKSDELAVSQLEKDIKDNHLVGRSIFLSARGNTLNQHLSGICSEMHEEEHKLNSTRGLLMDRTSELDAKVLEHLRQEEVWSQLGDEQSGKFFKIIAKELRRKGARARVNSCELSKLGNGTFEDFKNWLVKSDTLTVVFALDSFVRNKILRELLRFLPDGQEAGETHSSYFMNVEGQLSISKIRNDYAHQTEREIGTGHGPERCKFIRNELRKHLENVDAVTKAK
jgi:CheY-like chemotaxis protein